MKPPSFSASALRALQRYNWPGNVRELENLVERLAITHGGKRLGVNDLPAKYRFELVDDDQPVNEREDQDVLMELLLQREDDDPLTANAGATLPEEGIDLKHHLQELEQAFINQALEREQGVITRAAQLLGLQRTTLAEKMKKMGISQ